MRRRCRALDSEPLLTLVGASSKGVKKKSYAKQCAYNMTAAPAMDLYSCVPLFCLPGCTLFLYESDGRSGIDHNSVPKHALWVENSIVQAVPEHPKKEFVFCLSNSLGDAFLFQVRHRHTHTLVYVLLTYVDIKYYCNIEIKECTEKQPDNIFRIMSLFLLEMETRCIF